jgi:hypothetical protein
MKDMTAAFSGRGRVRMISGSAPPARTNRATKSGLARRSVERRVEPGREQVAGHGEAWRAGDPLPIWLSALVAGRCWVNRNGEDRAVRWNCGSGRALYTNAGADSELIQPLGVHLQGGQTLAVCWLPGETDYTVEVYWQDGMCA